jgi:glycopeptide antibiotics resistance protein
VTEAVQLFMRLGSFDIDDLILNLAGAMLEFLMWKTRLLQRFEKEYRSW